jgi:hypothetical protein
MRTFRGYRSAVKAGRGGQGASWVCLACSVAEGQTEVHGKRTSRTAKGERVASGSGP